MRTRQAVPAAALLSAAFILTACSAGAAVHVAAPRPTELDSSCIICLPSDTAAPTVHDSAADTPDEEVSPTSPDTGTGTQRPVSPLPIPSQPDSKPTAPACPAAIAGWTAGDLTLIEIPGNVNKPGHRN